MNKTPATVYVSHYLAKVIALETGASVVARDGMGQIMVEDSTDIRTTGGMIQLRYLGKSFHFDRAQLIGVAKTANGQDVGG